MTKQRIAVFSGPNATIANSPTLVTSNKGRRPGERRLDGRFDSLVAQELYEPVTVRIKRFSAHPLEADAAGVYHEPDRAYDEVELRPEDGPYPLPYVSRRADGSPDGVPFEDEDLEDRSIGYGGRQFYYPDAARLFAEIDRTITGRDEDGSGSTLDRRADFDFIRVLPSGGYASRGEVSGRDYFPYKPRAIAHRPRYRDLATATNVVREAMRSGRYAGGIWLEASPTLEETLYWCNLVLDIDISLVGCASQRPHGQLANDGDRNIVDAIDFILSGERLGVVALQDERIFAAREFKKADDRPGNYKVTGGHGGILGSVGPPVTVWYRPAYKHTHTSEVNLRRLPEQVAFLDRADDRSPTTIRIKDGERLRPEVIPRVHMVKYGAYMDEDVLDDPDGEVDIMARIARGLEQQSRAIEGAPPFHGFVFEGLSPYAYGSGSQREALKIAAFSGMPVVRVGRADPGGMVPKRGWPHAVTGSNLDANKARMLLMASMLKLGRWPKAKDPRHPTPEECDALYAAVAAYQALFDTH
ncbi:MAG TPA: asparaginase domain-containing protein [Actinomycetota bacterium]|nr:asparaginase domain-containing protein [Actinomycetota bacterium]